MENSNVHEREILLDSSEIIIVIFCSTRWIPTFFLLWGSHDNPASFITKLQTIEPRNTKLFSILFYLHPNNIFRFTDYMDSNVDSQTKNPVNAINKAMINHAFLA